MPPQHGGDSPEPRIDKELRDSYVSASLWVSVLKQPTLLTYAYQLTEIYLGRSYTTQITCYAPYSRLSPPTPTVIPSDHARAHNRLIPDRLSHLADVNFITRMLSCKAY